MALSTPRKASLSNSSIRPAYSLCFFRSGKFAATLGVWSASRIGSLDREFTQLFLALTPRFLAAAPGPHFETSFPCFCVNMHRCLIG